MAEEQPAKRASRKATKAPKAPVSRSRSPRGAAAVLRNPLVSSVSAVIPCRNDALTIASVVDGIEKAFAEAGVISEVIVVNDGSHDDSARVLDDLQAAHPSVRVITLAAPQGFGVALRRGLDASLHEWVLCATGDGRFDSADVEMLIELVRSDVDGVQGYVSGRGVSGWRGLALRAGRYASAIAFNLDVADPFCPLRLVRRAKLQDLALTARTSAVSVEVCRTLQQHGMRWVQVGVRSDELPAATPSSVVLTARELVRLWWQTMVSARRAQPVS